MYAEVVKDYLTALEDGRRTHRQSHTHTQFTSRCVDTTNPISVRTIKHFNHVTAFAK